MPQRLRDVPHLRFRCEVAGLHEAADDDQPVVARRLHQVRVDDHHDDVEALLGEPLGLFVHHQVDAEAPASSVP